MSRPARNRLSCADYTWPSLSQATVLTVISDLGFSGVDVGIFADSTHTTVASVMEDAHETARRLGQLADDAGLRVADLFLTPSLDLTKLTPSSPNPVDQANSEEVLERVLRVATTLGVSGVTILPGVVHSGDTYDAAIERSAAALRRRVALAAERDLALSVEPHFGSCIDTPRRTRQLLDLVPGLTLTLDPGHFVFGGATMLEVAELAGYTRHVQVRPGGPGVMQCRVGEGTVDVEFLVKSLEASGYDGWLASEFVWMEKWGCDRVDNTAEAAALRECMESALQGS